MPSSEPLSLAAIRARVDEVVRRSPADGISVTWLEVRRDAVCEGGRPRPAAHALERTIVVRVREGARLGESRTGSGEPSDLEAAVRLAVAASRVAPRLAGWEPPAASAADGPLPMLRDPAVAALDPESARQTLAGLVARREVADLDWAHGMLVTGGDLAVPRAAELTAISLRVRCGRRPGGGSAEGAARSLAALPIAEVIERARSGHGGTGLGELPETPVPAIVAASAAAKLLEGLVGGLEAPTGTWSGAAVWTAGLAGAGIELSDEPAGAGMPLPWDLLGRVRRPVAVPVAASEPLEPWSERPVGRNLCLRGRDPRPEGELLAAAEGGLWIGSVAGVELVPVGSGAVRFVGRGLRRIGAAGGLGDPVPDAVFELGLGELAALRGCGATLACRAAADRIWGGVSSPSLALASLPAGRPLPL